MMKRYWLKGLLLVLAFFLVHGLVRVVVYGGDVTGFMLHYVNMFMFFSGAWGGGWGGARGGAWSYFQPTHHATHHPMHQKHFYL